MKRWKYIFLGALFLLLLLFLPDPHPAQASSAFSPGLYYGYVTFLARTDFDGTATVEGGAKHRYVWGGSYALRGKLQLRINDTGSVNISALMPTTITLIDFYNGAYPEGYCEFYDKTVADSYVFDLERWYPSMTNAFQVPYKPASKGISYTFENYAFNQGGNVTNCAVFGQGALPAGRYVIKGNLDMFTAIQFKTIYSTDMQMGGTCSLPGWTQSYSFQPFSTPNVYSVSYCNWHVYKLNSGKPQKGNQ